jgi:hypothetical protein
VSILAVKTYIAAQAPLISLTNTIWQHVHGYRQRPKREKVGVTTILTVGRVRRREDRETIPRGSAEKLNAYTVDVLLYAEHSDEQVGGDHFDALIENTCDVYRRATPGNPTLVDAIIGQTSYVTHIGEHIDVDLLDVEFVGGQQSRVAFRAILTLDVSEILSPA